MKFQLFAFRRSKLEIVGLILIATFLLLDSTSGEAWWAKKIKELSHEDVGEIARELLLYGDPNFPRYNDIFYRNYRDPKELLNALNREIEINKEMMEIIDIDERKIEDLIYGVYILNAIDEKNLVEIGSKCAFKPDKATGEFFHKLANNLAYWKPQIAKIILEQLLKSVFVAIGSPGLSIGVSTLCLATDLTLIGIGIDKLNDLLYERGFWGYMVSRRLSNDHDAAWDTAKRMGAGAITNKNERQTEEYFKSLWDTYGESISDDGLKEDFKAEQRKKLKALLLYALGAEPHPVISSPLKITSRPYREGDEITAEFTITNKGKRPIFLKTVTVGGRYESKNEVIDFTKRHNIELDIEESYKYHGTLTLAKAGNYHFFCAYQTPDDKWNPSVDLGHGLTDEDRIEDIVVTLREETKPTLVKASSPPEVIWSREFPIEMCLRGVQQTPDGGYILVGDRTQEDFIGLIKTDPQGQKIWEARMRYDGPWVQSFQQTSDGGYILLAHAGRFRGTDYTMYLIKTDATGHKIWEKGFEEERKYQNTVGVFIRETPDGGYILGGTRIIRTDSKKYPEKYHPWLMKTNSKGDIQWEKVFEEEGYAFDFQQTSDGGYILALHTGLTKTDPSGRKIWKRIYEKGHVFLAQETSDGGYILAGATPIDEEKYRPWLMKTNSKGDIQWKTTSEHVATVGARAGVAYGGILQQTPDGGYILAGTIYESKYRPWLMKTNSKGDIQWEKVFEEEGSVLSQTLDGGYILGVFSGDYHRYHLVKVRSPGEAPKKQIIEVAEEPREEKKKEKEELFSYCVDYEPIAYGGFPFLLVNVSGPADELGIILTNPEGWSTATFISRRDLIDNFESVKVSMCQGRNPPAGTYKLVIKTITPEKVVYKTEARFTPPVVKIRDAELKLGELGRAYWVAGTRYYTKEFSMTIKNWGDLPIFLNKVIIIIPQACAWTEKIREIKIPLFTSVPYGETKIKEEGNYGYLKSYTPYLKVKLYSEGNEVASSSVKVTIVE